MAKTSRTLPYDRTIVRAKSRLSPMPRGSHGASAGAAAQPPQPRVASVTHAAAASTGTSVSSQHTVRQPPDLSASFRVAVCYWGLTRSVRLGTHFSHAKHVIGLLNSSIVDHHVFIHTWDPPGGKQRVWYGGDIAGKRWPLSTPIDYEEWRLLKPHFFRRDNQSEFKLTLRGDWERYHGGKDAWDWQLAMNCLCAVESIRRVHAMVLQSGWPHTHLVFVRPDVVLLNDLPLHTILSLSADEAAIPSWGHNKGVNDQVCART